MELEVQHVLMEVGHIGGIESAAYAVEGVTCVAECVALEECCMWHM